jgi:hypothetical protein
MTVRQFDLTTVRKGKLLNIDGIVLHQNRQFYIVHISLSICIAIIIYIDILLWKQRVSMAAKIADCLPASKTK